jgi:hypothetical protein
MAARRISSFNSIIFAQHTVRHHPNPSASSLRNSRDRNHPLDGVPRSRAGWRGRMNMAVAAKAIADGNIQADAAQTARRTIVAARKAAARANCSAVPPPLGIARSHPISAPPELFRGVLFATPISALMWLGIWRFVTWIVT